MALFLWEEDTEKNLDKSENVSQIFTSDSSNKDFPNGDPIPRQKIILELKEKEEGTSRTHPGFLGAA